jgi:hypothetical protein
MRDGPSRQVQQPVTAPRSTSVFAIPHFGPSIAWRLLWTWLGVRLAIAGFTAMAGRPRGGPSPLLVMSPSGSAVTVAVVVALFWLTTRRRNEDLFLRALGFETVHLLALFTGLTILLELLTQGIGRAVR